MSGTNICSDIYTDPALTFVDLGWAQFQQYAFESYNLARVQIEGLNNFETPLHEWDASFATTGNLTGFLRPTRPDILPITMPAAVTIPDAPSLAIPALVIGLAPDEPSDLNNMPQLVLPPTPDALDAERPGDAPVMVIPDAPVAPVLEEIPAPVLEQVELPEVPVIEIEMFSELAPVFDAAPPSEQIDFVEAPFASEFLDEIQLFLRDWRASGGLIPVQVASQLWDRAVYRDDTSALKRTQEARDQHAALGFEEPAGQLSARMREVRQENQNSRAAINRDMYVQDQTVAIENLKFAVQQGMQLEFQLLQAHLTVEQRKFDYAVQSKQVAIAVFNARVAQYNAAVAAYNARIEAYKAYLDGLRAQVDVYRAQVEAAKVLGEINEQNVRIYSEQVRAQLSYAELYRAQVEGFKATVDAERSKIEGYRAQVEAYNSLVQAYTAEWDGYRAQLQGQVTKGQFYDTLARVHATRIGAWQTEAQVAVAAQQAELAKAEAFMRQHENQIRAILAQLEVARAVIAAQSATNDANARMYEADARLETAVSDADSRAFQAETERARTSSELATRDAELQIQQLIQRAGLLLRAMESGSQASSQLAAASFSAMNFSAGISSSQSRSKNCSTSFSYAGEIGDAGA